MGTERLLAKPLQGGLFGYGEYELATLPCIERGLHGVRYLVIQRRAGVVVSVADEKHEALAGARRVISASFVAANDRSMSGQGELWDDLPGLPEPLPPAPPVSRRRRQIFERTDGRCFYCSVSLQLEGVWDVEHQMPRALGGGDNPLNLVAACVRCNRGKADRTALEFIASGKSAA
jgi:hypothetical protein